MAAQIIDQDLLKSYYKELRNLGVHSEVAKKLVKIYSTGKLVHKDVVSSTVIGELKEFSAEDGLKVLNFFEKMQLEHIINRISLLQRCMNHVRRSMKNSQRVPKRPHGADVNLAGDVVADKVPGEAAVETDGAVAQFTLKISPGERSYTTQPDFLEPPPIDGCKVFVWSISPTVNEGEFIKKFGNYGKIVEARFMIEQKTGINRGYAIVTYAKFTDADRAAKQMHDVELSGRHLKAAVSYPNLRLLVSDIPPSLRRNAALEKFKSVAGGVDDVILDNVPGERQKGRGFCVVVFESKACAENAKNAFKRLFFLKPISIEWMDPQEDPKHAASISGFFQANCAI